MLVMCPITRAAPSLSPTGWQTESERGHRSLFALVVAWLIVIVYATGISLTIWLEHRLHVRDDPPLEDALLIAGLGAFAVVGALLVARRPTNLIGWIMAAVALMVGLGLVGDAYAAYVMTTRGRPDALAASGARGAAYALGRPGARFLSRKFSIWLYLNEG